jgi:integrase
VLDARRASFLPLAPPTANLSVERRQTRAGSARYVGRVKSAGRHVAAKTFRRKADAEMWAREQYRALAFGEFIPPTRSATPFADVVAGFVESRREQVSPHTWRTDSDNLASAVAAWGSRPLSSIGASELLTFFTGQLAIKARSTVQRSRTSLSALFAYAVREKMLTRNPVAGVRLPPGKHQESDEVDTFSDAELAHVLARQHRINPRMAEVTEFLSLTGLRWSELRALRVADLHSAPFPSIRVVRAQSDGYPEKGTKTYRGRVVPLTTRALDIAAPRARDRQPGDYLFTSSHGAQLRGDVFRRTVRGRETAPGRTLHHLRHYAASHWLRSGVPVHQVAKWLGHANPSTTLKVYAHVLGEAQDMAAVAHLNAIAVDR